MAAKHIIQVPLAQLHPHPRNARTHPPKQVAQLATSIRRFGFNVPILIDANGQIICGHARVDAAKDLGFSHVPAIRIEHLNDEEVRAYVIADNRLAEKAGWDTALLALEGRAPFWLLWLGLPFLILFVLFLRHRSTHKR